MAKNIKKYFAMLIIALFVLAPAVYAQDAEKLIDDAKRYYKQGDYYKATDYLDKAKKKINDMMGEKLVLGLPPAPRDFVISKSTEREEGQEEVSLEEGISRKYKSTNVENAEIEVSINPVLLMEREVTATSEGQEIYVGGKKAILNFDPEEKNGVLEIYLTNAIVCVYSSGFASSNVMIDFAKRIDLGKIESLMK